MVDGGRAMIVVNVKASNCILDKFEQSQQELKTEHGDDKNRGILDDSKFF